MQFTRPHNLSVGDDCLEHDENEAPDPLEVT